MDEQAHTIADMEEKVARLVEDRAKAQLVIESLKEQAQHVENLRRDRAKAQLIMDSQSEQLKHWTAEANTALAKVETLRSQLKEAKAILKAAKLACRKKGRCFQIETGPKVRRSLGERFARELRRLPRNLGIAREEAGPGAPEKLPAALVTDAPLDRYAAWIKEHEPDAEGLKEQQRIANELNDRVKISLLTPVYDTPASFLEEMFASVAGQTWSNWELCIVDGGSTRAETLETLRRWETRDARIRVARLTGNLGIAENTNQALRLATGDFVACLDHDDVLAPFALYELARKSINFPDADILYSDEDRLSETGKRHTPFFKPEWSPELLLNSMYIGHLSAYRRSLANALGGFRKEFDLSQDYDFALRATEQAKSICHIPAVLYHWREHPASGSTGGKPATSRPSTRWAT